VQRILVANCRNRWIAIQGAFMSPHQTIAVAARLFAVWLALGLPAQLYQFWRLGDDVATPGLRLLTAGVALLSATVAAVLWFFPLTVARKFLRSPDNPAPAPASAEAWVSAGCALIGIWLFAKSFPAFIVDMAILLSTLNGGGTETRSSVIYEFINVVLAVWLILGAKGFAAVVQWAKSAGIRKEGS
jgi:hypothetical protein